MLAITKEGKAARKDLEPGIIDDDMIKSVVLDGYKGEAGRLARLDKIDLSIVGVLRLEFQKILKIDHLWVLPNLKVLSLAFNKLEKIENLDMLTNLLELNLSFNFITKIENLDSLARLEILSLYGNQIEALENIDNLDSLLIFSVGDNRIASYEGIERLRFLKTLRSFNMEENPVAQDLENPLRLYIAAFLPNLKYYNYAFISDQERVELRELEEREKTEIKEREVRAKEHADEIRLSECFVEYLNAHQLFDSLFIDDPEGDALMSIEAEVNDMKKDYREEAFKITQQIYEIGLHQHWRRQREIQMFEEAIKEARETAQSLGVVLINDFLEMARKAKAELRHMEASKSSRDEEGLAKLQKDASNVKTEFEEKLHWLKKKIMGIEIQLYENVEEANRSFEHVIQQMTVDFIELTQAQFVFLRDAETTFNEAICETAQRHATLILATHPDGSSLPKPLADFLMDKNCIKTLARHTRDLHIQRIDAREDRLITRSKSWVRELNEKLQRDEVRRNRSKIQEIMYFVQSQRDKMEKVYAGIGEI